jgi:FimV-like protein
MIKNQLTTLLIIFGLLFPLLSDAGEYGPVAAKETLWSIASHNRPSYEVTTQQMMLAIRSANPNAFEANNINTLKKGAMLRLPSLAEVQQISTSQALQAAKQENTHWKSQQNIDTAKQKTANASQQPPSYKRHYQASQRELTKLQKRLKRERQQIRSLKTEITALKTTNPYSSKPTTGKASEDNQALHKKIAELEQILQEKNVHIAQLENMKLVASETIKRQLANNELLFNKLKAIDPKHVTNLSAASGSLELKGTDTVATQPPSLTAQQIAMNTPVAEESTGISQGLLIALFVVSLPFIFYILWGKYIKHQAEKRLDAKIELRENMQKSEIPIVTTQRKEPQLGT